MSNIYAEILERVERGEALTLKTELCGSDGLIAEGKRLSRPMRRRPISAADILPT